MNILSNSEKRLHINVTTAINAATIYLRGSFIFDAHREFKNTYKNLLQNPNIGSIILNLAEVKYVDSAALGMLLLLRERIQAANKSLTLSQPSPYVKRIFEIANFHSLFAINLER